MFNAPHNRALNVFNILLTENVRRIAAIVNNCKAAVSENMPFQLTTARLPFINRKAIAQAQLRSVYFNKSLPAMI